MSTRKAYVANRLDNLSLVRTLGRLERLVDTLPGLWAVVCLAIIFILLEWLHVRPHDFWWHVRVGHWIVEKGGVPDTDLFSFTRAGEPWAYQSWLMEVIFYLLLRVGGLPLVIFIHAVTVTAAYGLLLRVNQRANGGDLRWAAVATVAAAGVGIATWNVRPQTVSFLLFALTLYVIDGRRVRLPRGRSGPWGEHAMWCLPPLFAFWANAHGGFVFGLGLLGVFAFARLLAWLRRQCRFPVYLLLITVLSAGATMLTPLGLDMPDYVLGFLRHPVTRGLNLEFMPPTVQTLSGQLFFGFLILWIVLLLASRYRPTVHESMRLLLFGGLALMAGRNMAWFGFVAAPTMAASLRCWADDRGVARGARVGRFHINRAIAALVGVLAVLSLPWFRPYLPLAAPRRAYLCPETPVKAVAFLCELPQPFRVFHTEGYGSYMIWACPEVPVFIDTRIELYPPGQWRDYLALSQARYDWEAILERYGVDTLLLHRQKQGSLIEAATAARGWERPYEDQQAVIFQRRAGP